MRALDYSKKILFSIYELGRLYFEMGYFAPAERIFVGLAGMDGGQTPSLVGLGLVKLECGLFPESIAYFREALEREVFPLQAKLGLSAAFISTGEYARARSILTQIKRDQGGEDRLDEETRMLWEALDVRCQAA